MGERIRDKGKGGRREGGRNEEESGEGRKWVRKETVGGKRKKRKSRK